MGLLPSIDTLKDAATDLGLGGLFGLEDKSVDPIYSAEGPESDLFPEGEGKKGAKVPWAITGTDWHKVFAYQFVVVNEKEEEEKEKKSEGLFKDFVNNFVQGLKETFAGPAESTQKREFYYTLPIPPQSMAIRMIPASQATATIGGVVEETSENVFWTIAMSGTTGIGVTRGETGVVGGRNKVATQFRDKITTTGLMSGPLAAVNGVLSKVGGVADAGLGAAAALGSGDLTGFASGVVGAINTALLPPLPYAGSGIDRESNGFTEMQELHRFLYTYSKLKATNPHNYKLKFRNFKTNQQWDCILQDFQIQQNAQNPMLQRYNIILKCWNVKPVGADARASAEFDRFGPDGDLKAVSIISVDQMAKLHKLMTGSKHNSVEILLGGG